MLKENYILFLSFQHLAQDSKITVEGISIKFLRNTCMMFFYRFHLKLSDFDFILYFLFSFVQKIFVKISEYTKSKLLKYCLNILRIKH